MRKGLLLLAVVIFTGFNLFISYQSSQFIPYLGLFTLREMFDFFNFPFFIESFANFDGLHYMIIGRNGYVLYQEAFFPLFPSVVGFLGRILKENFLLAGLLITNISFFFGLLIFDEYVKKLVKSEQFVNWALLFLFVFPTSFFFNAVYTESVFFLFIVCALYWYKKDRYLLSALAGYLAALTRVVGFFLCIPLFLEVMYKMHLAGAVVFSRKGFKFDVKCAPQKIKEFLHKNYIQVLSVIAPILGFASYSIYLGITKKDPFLFFHAQPAFGANRSTDLVLLPQVVYRYIKIFITANHDFRYFVSAVEFGMFMLVFSFLLWELWKIFTSKMDSRLISRLGLNLFSLANLVLPTLTGTFSSITRYSLLSLAVFLVMAEIKWVWLKILLSVIFLVFHVILLAYFIQGYFVG